jgi:hypothetical protein
MRLISIPLSLLLVFMVFFPGSTQAFWGKNTESDPVLDSKSGYDVNTVTTVTGKILTIQTGADRQNVQLEIESDTHIRMIVFLGPQRYWVVQGIPLQRDDMVVVRGSKAQGQGGVIYIMAQEITEISQGVSVILRDGSGRPNWVGVKTGSGNGTGLDDAGSSGGAGGGAGGSGSGHGGRTGGGQGGGGHGGRGR